MTLHKMREIGPLGTFFLCKLGNWFTVFLLSNLLVVDVSPVDFHGWIETFALITTLFDTWVVMSRLDRTRILEVFFFFWFIHENLCVLSTFFIYLCIRARSLCALLDTFNVTACSLCNSFEGFFSVFPDLLPSLVVANDCIFKSISNNFSCSVIEFRCILPGISALLVSALKTFSECWAVTLCIYHTFLGLFKIFIFSHTVEIIHLRLEDALLKFVGIALDIHCSESVPFCPEIYPWLNVFAVGDVPLSSSSSNYMVKINPVLLSWYFLSFFICLLKNFSLIVSILESFLIISNWR